VPLVRLSLLYSDLVEEIRPLTPHLKSCRRQTIALHVVCEWHIISAVRLLRLRWLLLWSMNIEIRVLLRSAKIISLVDIRIVSLWLNGDQICRLLSQIQGITHFKILSCRPPLLNDLLRCWECLI